MGYERTPIDWSKHKVWTEDQMLAERQALDDQLYGRWGRAIEVEIRRRIQLTVATYAYEVKDDPFLSDDQWDRLAQTINPRLGTCHPVLDEFFASRFSPMTGMWIHEHPELDKVSRLYNHFYRLRRSFRATHGVQPAR